MFLLTLSGFWLVIWLRNYIVSFAFVNSSVNILTYFFRSSINKFLGSSFLTGLLEINEAQQAYYNVLIFSSKYVSQGFKQASIRQ